jgi:hypothetical protein
MTGKLQCYYVYSTLYVLLLSMVRRQKPLAIQQFGQKDLTVKMVTVDASISICFKKAIQDGLFSASIHTVVLRRRSVFKMEAKSWRFIEQRIRVDAGCPL